MKKNPNLLWITAVVLGWLFDFLFWKKPLGFNFAIYTLLCMIGGFLILRMDKQQPARSTLWLIPLILFFADSRAQSTPCFSATARYIAHMTDAGELMVIETVTSPSGIP